MLDYPDDFDRQISLAVGVLDERVAIPRTVLFDNAASGNLDVTAFDIDEICAVYYSPSGTETLLGGLDLGVGAMPIITSQMAPVSAMESMIDYLVFKNVFNAIQRKMMNTEDYFMLPVTSDGRQILQVRNQGKLFVVHYLPYLKPEASGWALFEPEYQYLLNRAFYMVMYANAEAQMNASLLSASKEAVNLANFYDKKIADLDKQFDEAVQVPFMG